MNGQRPEHAKGFAKGDYVLVIDDDEQIQGLVTIVLESAGYKVKTVENGEKALELINFEQPRLILLDMYTPTIDGWTFLALYPQTAGQHAPIIAMSAALEGKTMPGVVSFLRKPFDITELVALVSEYTGQPDSETQSS